MITSKLNGLRVLIFFICVYSFLSGHEKKTLAILDLEDIGISPIEAKALTQRLRSELVGTSRFIVLERGKMNRILDEMKFQISGCTSSECMVEVGQILGMQLMVGGSVSKVGNLYSIDLRLIDVETSAILSKATKDIEGKIENVMKAGIKAVAIEIATGRPASVSIPITEVSGEVKTITGDYGNMVQKITDIDGNVYNTIVIGTKVWMAENLKVTRYRNGVAIPNVTDATEWSNLTTGAYCNYGNNTGKAATYGRLYNWYAVNDSRNIAPEGWHVPSKAEWQTLVDYLGGYDITGGKMKETGTEHWSRPNRGSTNESGFSALPGGFRSSIGNFISMGTNAFFWSSTESSSNTAWYQSLYCHYLGVYHYDNGRNRIGLSVRCVRN